MKCSIVFSLAVMAVGAAAFIFVPDVLIHVFSQDAEVLAVGAHAFPIIGTSFLPAVVSLMMPVFFQLWPHQSGAFPAAADRLPAGKAGAGLYMVCVPSGRTHLRRNRPDPLLPRAETLERKIAVGLSMICYTAEAEA